MVWLEQATSNTERGLYTLALLMLLTLGLVLITFLVVVWSKWMALPFGAKLLCLLGLGIVGLMVALVVGWVAEDSVRQAYAAAVAQATHLWRIFDGFTRSHRWVGMVLLALLPALLWPSDEEE
jgi:hypothetical protein